MLRRASHFALVASLFSALVGCAAGTEAPTGLPVGDTGGIRDTGKVTIDTAVPVEEDTGSPIADTGAKEDSSAPSDSASADTSTGDTALPVDSTTPIDSSVADTSLPPVDTSVADTSVADTAIVVDSAPTDGGSGPTKIYTGSSLRLHGVTTDDFAIVSDASTTWAVPLTGGAPQSIGSGTTVALISGSVAFAWGTTDTYGFAPLRVWSNATGSKSIATKSLAPTSSAYFVAGASQDGSYIFFTDGGYAGFDYDEADFKVARTDGTSVRTVFAGYAVYDYVDGYDDACAPSVTWASGRFVTNHCTTTSFSISFDASSIDPATGAATSLGTNLGAYPATDDPGTKVAIISSTGALKMVPVTGGPGVSIDTSVSTGVFTHDGSAFVYRTTGSALKRSPTASSSPTTLVTSGVARILTVPSPNDQWLLYASTGSSGAYDIRRASTTTAGSTTLHASANGDVYGDAFTADSAYAIFFTAVDTLGAGTLVAYPMSGGTATTLGTGAWYDFATSGAKLVFNDNHVGTTTSGTATLRTRDVAGGTSTTIATSADRNFSLNPARNKVVYVIPSDGLYAASVP